MPSWKKVIVSGSNAVLNQITASGNFVSDGTVIITGNTGRVGINTLAPDYKLDVAGNAGFNEYLYHNGDSNTYLRYQSDKIDLSAGGNVFQINNRAISGSLTSTGSFGRVEASIIGGNSPLEIESDNFNVSSDGVISGSGISTGSFGHILASNIRTSRLGGKSPLVIEADNFNVDDVGTYSGSASSTGSFGAVSIGKGAPDNQRALTVVGNAQFNNNAQIYFKRSNGTADPYITYDSSNNFHIFNPVAGEIQFSVGSGKILDIESTGINFNGSKSITTSTGAGVITVNGNSGVILKSGTGGGSGPIQFMHGSTVVSEVTTTHAISGSSTSTGSFGKLLVDDARFKDDIFIGSSGTSGFRNGSDTNISVYIANNERFKFYNHGGNIYFASNNASGPNIYSAASSTTQATYLISGRTNTGFGGGVDKISGIVDGTEVLRIASNTISGSSTSTGSFGRGVIADTLRINKVNASATPLMIGAPSANMAVFHISNHLGNEMFRVDASSDGDAALTMRDSGQNADIYLHTATHTYFNNNGNFGIGTTSPGAKLTVHGDISGSLTSTGSFGNIQVDGDFLPTTDNNTNLGSPSKRFANIHSADLQLSNEGTEGNDVDGTTGNWTLQEGEEDIYLINNKTGKKYSIMLKEVKQ